MSVGIGAIKELTTLSDETKQKYLVVLNDILKFIVGTHTTVTLEGQGTYDLKMMQDVAEAVGKIIVTAKLNSFKNNSIQDIITYTDEDEEITQSLVKKVLSKLFTSFSFVLKFSYILEDANVFFFFLQNSPQR